MNINRISHLVIAIGLIVLALPFAVVAQGTPVADGAWNTDLVGGNGFEVLTPAAEGTVDVIAMGEAGPEMPILIHNNTDEAIEEIVVDVVVRDTRGNLFALGSSMTLGHNPGRLEPGDIGLGTVHFPVASMPPEITMESQVHFTVSSSPGSFGSVPGEVADWVQQGTDVVGVVVNPHDDLAMTSPIDTQVACLSDEGTILSVTDGNTLQEEIPAGGETRFEVTLPTADCEHMLIIVTGNNL